MHSQTSFTKDKFPMLEIFTDGCKNRGNAFMFLYRGERNWRDIRGIQIRLKNRRFTICYWGSDND